MGKAISEDEMICHKEKLYQGQQLKSDFLMACPAFLNLPPMADMCHHMLLSTLYFHFGYYARWNTLSECNVFLKVTLQSKHCNTYAKGMIPQSKEVNDQLLDQPEK